MHGRREREKRGAAAEGTASSRSPPDLPLPAPVAGVGCCCCNSRSSARSGCSCRRAFRCVCECAGQRRSASAEKPLHDQQNLNRKDLTYKKVLPPLLLLLLLADRIPGSSLSFTITFTTHTSLSVSSLCCRVSPAHCTDRDNRVIVNDSILTLTSRHSELMRTAAAGVRERDAKFMLADQPGI